MVSAPAGFLVDMFQTQIHVLFVNLSLIPVWSLRGRTELVCAHGKRDPRIKFTGLEFCLPFAQTVNWPVFPCKWPWETVNNLYFRMSLKREVKSLDFGNWHFIQYFTKGTICNTFVQKCVMRILYTVPNTQNEQKSFGYKNKILVGKHYVHMLHWNETLPNITDN